MSKAVFEGLIFDTGDNPVAISQVGADATYVVIEDGFAYHVDAHRVDEQVMARFAGQVQENRDLIGEGMMKMLGKGERGGLADAVGGAGDEDCFHPLIPRLRSPGSACQSAARRRAGR